MFPIFKHLRENWGWVRFFGYEYRWFNPYSTRMPGGLRVAGRTIFSKYFYENLTHCPYCFVEIITLRILVLPVTFIRDIILTALYSPLGHGGPLTSIRQRVTNYYVEQSRKKFEKYKQSQANKGVIDRAESA